MARSHLDIMAASSKHALVISATENSRSCAFSAEMTGAASAKWMRGYRLRLVWNSVISTLSTPSSGRRRRRDDLADQTVQVGVRRALNVDEQRPMS